MPDEGARHHTGQPPQEDREDDDPHEGDLTRSENPAQLDLTRGVGDNKRHKNDGHGGQDEHANVKADGATRPPKTL
jgi:hypothetical protein